MTRVSVGFVGHRRDLALDARRGLVEEERGEGAAERLPAARDLVRGVEARGTAGLDARGRGGEVRVGVRGDGWGAKRGVGRVRVANVRVALGRPTTLRREEVARALAGGGAARRRRGFAEGVTRGRARRSGKVENVDARAWRERRVRVRARQVVRQVVRARVGTLERRVRVLYRRPQRLR